MRYTLSDLLRSRWVVIYLSFFLLLTLSLLSLSGDVSQVVISLMNIILILCPLVAVMFGVMFFYNSREFTELLLAQPLRRTDIFFGQYLGLALSLSASLVIGVGLPFLIYGLFASAEVWNFMVLIVIGVALTFIFSGLAFYLALCNDNRIRGFGLAILLWLFFAIIYDGIFLLSLIVLRDYPLEHYAMAMTILNPIDLARILILLKLDISALMGYTGAVFHKFLGSLAGSILAFLALALWVVLPVWRIRWRALRKDF